MKKPDKYPLIDPELPNLYARILEAANVLRRERVAASSAGWAAIREERIASIKRVPKESAPVLFVVPE